jgi:hypothetical protein
MPFIRVDETVFAHLCWSRRCFDTKNDIIRALLGLPPAPRGTSKTDPPTPGALLPLITAGALIPGQTFTWTRRSLRETHTATVDEAGRMVTADGASFHTPGHVRFRDRRLPLQRMAPLAHQRRRIAAATA